MSSTMPQWALNHLSVSNWRCTGNLRLCTHFEVERMKNASFNNFEVQLEILGSDMCLTRSDRALHSCQSCVPIKSMEAILSCCVRIQDAGSQIPSTAEAFTGR